MRQKVGDAFGTKNRRQKTESIYGARFWSVCHAHYVYMRLELGSDI